MKADDFATLLCSRLCHDLISPVGAITNALELLDEDIDAETEQQVMTLLRQSASQTSRKLQFFRLAFGAAGGFSETLDMREAEKAAAGLLESLRVTAEWTGEAQSTSKSGIKLLLCLILIASETLVRGGHLVIGCEADTDGILSAIELTASGERLILQNSVEATLKGEFAGAPDPRSSPAYLAREVAMETGLTLYLDKSSMGAEAAKLIIGASGNRGVNAASL